MRFENTSRMKRTAYTRAALSVFAVCLLLLVSFSNLQHVIRVCVNTCQDTLYMHSPAEAFLSVNRTSGNVQKKGLSQIQAKRLTQTASAAKPLLYETGRTPVEIAGRDDSLSTRTQSRLTGAPSKTGVSYQSLRILLTAFIRICMILLFYSEILEISRRSFTCSQKFIILYIHNTDGKKG